MSTGTVRELGGEIWAEIGHRHGDPGSALGRMDVDQVQEIVDVVMGVLARYADVTIAADATMPVTPLPRRTFE
jgi:hypothetical protein